MLNCGLLTQKDLNRIQADKINLSQHISVFADDNENEFVVYKVTSKVYIVV